MKKYEILVEDESAQELTRLLQGLPFVKEVRESGKQTDAYTLASEASLAEDWNSEEDDAFQKMYGK